MVAYVDLSSSNFDNMQGHILSTNALLFSSSFMNVVNFESWVYLFFSLLHFNNGFSSFHLRNLHFACNNYGNFDSGALETKNQNQVLRF
jgi:hypothetical protein